MTKDDAIKRTSKFIRDNCQPPISDKFNVNIYTWGVEEYGVRVAEVSISNESGGSSWMQSDIPAWPIIFGTERLILAYMTSVDSTKTEGENGWPEDDVEMAEFGLRNILNEKE